MLLKPDPLYDDVKPYAIASDSPPGIKKSNIINTSCETKVANARGQEKQFSLYSTGFEWVQQPFERKLSNDEEIDQFMVKMELILQDHLHARKVIAYDYVISQQRDQKEPRGLGVSRTVKKQILGAHLDIIRESAEERIKLNCGELESNRLLRGKWHIVNAWRPITGPVKSMPLTVCDSSTLAGDDIVASNIVLPHLQIEAYEICFNRKQKWYYLEEQETDEVLIMMSCDSETDTRNGASYSGFDGSSKSLGCAHTAFEDPSTLPGDPKRESIELRCMIFF